MGGLEPPRPPPWLRYWAQYKFYRNKLTHIKEYAKRLYIKNIVNDNKHDTSSLWKIKNKIIHLKNVKKSVA